VNATDAFIVIARALHFAACVSLTGVFAFECLVAGRALRANDTELGDGFGRRRRLSVLARASLALALVSGAAWLAGVAANMSGEPLGALKPSTIAIVLTETRVGKDWLLRLALAVLLGGPLLIATLLLMERAGRWWWVWAWGLWLAVMFLMAWAWPAFIAPLFNRFSPLEDQALRQRIEALLTRCGFASKGVFVVDNSRRSSHGNAYFTGIGRHKRIVFFDTLLERLAHPEVEAVLAHELGHFRLKHVRRRLWLSIAVTFVGLAVLGWLTGQAGFYAALGVPVPSTHAALLLFALVVPVFTFFITPLASLWSRRHEFEADAFATRHASATELATALVKLHRDNASTLTPDPVYAAFYYSHPPPLARIARLRASGAAPAS